MSSEKHLHPAAMIVGGIRTLRRWISGLAFPGVVLLVSQGFSLWTVTLFLLGLIVVAALAALWGFLSWRATTYAVTGNSFRLRQGVFQKNERTIPLEHVQSVDTVQGIIQRAFGVYEVRIETAGGGASEPDASLAALDRDAARTLRREIEGSERAVSEETAGPKILRRLSTRELLVAGATSGQIGVAFSVLAIGFQFLDNFFPEDFVRRLVETLAPNWLMVVLILLPTGLLLAWLLAIGGTVLAYSGFTLSRQGDFLYIKRGLLERREATIPLSRIQAVRVSEGLLRQPFGLASLRVESAGYGEDSGVSTTLFPLLPRDEVEELTGRCGPRVCGRSSHRAAPAPRPPALRIQSHGPLYDHRLRRRAGLLSRLPVRPGPPRASPDTTRRRVRMAMLPGRRLGVRRGQAGRAPPGPGPQDRRRTARSPAVAGDGKQSLPAACAARYLPGRGRLRIWRIRASGQGPRRGSRQGAGR